MIVMRKVRAIWSIKRYAWGWLMVSLLRYLIQIFSIVDWVSLSREKMRSISRTILIKEEHTMVLNFQISKASFTQEVLWSRILFRCQVRGKLEQNMAMETKSYTQKQLPRDSLQLVAELWQLSLRWHLYKSIRSPEIIELAVEPPNHLK